MSLEQPNFRAETMAMIDQANEILQEYSAQGFTLTLRQLYYQFVARQLIANEVREYGRLGRIVVDARRAGLIDWDHIEDRTRGLMGWSFWAGPADAIHRAASSYSEDLWRHQAVRLEVWVEKAALVGVIEPACERWRVPYMAARGYASHSEIYAAGKRLARHINKRKAVAVLYLGDHDPSGLDMLQALARDMSLYASQPG